jgi:ribosomal-protein-alanine N-acetyltransferase
MNESDLDGVTAIEQASFSHPWRREHFAHELASTHSFPFVAVYDGVLCGFVCLMSLFEEAQILDVVVAPNQRGRGIARLLMAYAFDVAREQGAHVMALEVRASNTAAITLYERLGFSRCGTRRGYYEGTEDAILMEKSLQGDS